jgi:tetratricopeptide (TPR) repeat protein
MRLAACLLLSSWITSAQPSNSDETFRRGIAAQQRRDFTEAIKDYRLVLEKRPDLTEARIRLAAALTEMGRVNDAISVLTPASGKPGVRKNLAIAYYRKNDLAGAIREFEALDATERADAQTARVLADCYLRAGIPAKALRLIEPLAKSHPTDAALQYQLGVARIRTGVPGEALDPLERAGKQGRMADAYLLAGATALELGQMQRAREDLEKAVGIDPKIPGAWTWTGMARDRVSDEEGAKQAYRAALQLEPRDFEANLHLGAILYRERNMEAAKPFLDHALSIQPKSSLALYAMALVRAAINDIDQAVQELEMVTAAEPEWVEPHVKLASLYFRLHREIEGRREQELVDKLRNEHRDKKVPLPEIH